MTNRERAALETKQKLLKTGLKLIKKHGLENITVSDITTAAHVAKGTFYTYFDRKEDIIFEICRDAYADLEKNFYADTSHDIVKKLTKYFHAFMAEVERYDINICREWIRDVINPKTAPTNRDTQKWFFDVQTLIRILQTAVKNGELTKNAPIGAIAYIIMSELYGMMTGWCMSDGGFQPLDWTARFCELQLKPMLAPYLPVGKKK